MSQYMWKGRVCRTGVELDLIFTLYNLGLVEDFTCHVVSQVAVKEQLYNIKIKVEDEHDGR